jgi:hypothetical protein
MTSPIDIFQIEDSGSVIWVHSVATLDAARARVRELSARSPGDYLLLNQTTGEKFVLHANGTNGFAKADPKPRTDVAHATNGGETKSPDWQVLLQELAVESDREQALEKMHKVETLVFERLLRLRAESDGHVEREAINGALSLLRTIKRDKLGFPDWK